MKKSKRKIYFRFRIGSCKQILKNVVNECVLPAPFGQSNTPSQTEVMLTHLPVTFGHNH